MSDRTLRAGHYLAILSIEPQLAKMLLLATSLGCLDPVLTIACVMTYRDPFVLPMNPNVKVRVLPPCCC